MTYRRYYERVMQATGWEGHEQPLRPGWADAAGAAAGAQEREERHTAKAPPRFTPETRERMAASQRARWAAIRARGQK